MKNLAVYPFKAIERLIDIEIEERDKAGMNAYFSFFLYTSRLRRL